MKLIDALELVARPDAPQAPTRCFLLACRFTPLHLRTFLRAHLRRRFPEEHVEVTIGLYGDLAGNLERASAGSIDSAAVVIEWSDLDLRLSIRQLGGWAPEVFPDILACARVSLERLKAALV